MNDQVIGPADYVATYCRLERHEECQAHPMVLCACPCHDAEVSLASNVAEAGRHRQSRPAPSR